MKRYGDNQDLRLNNARCVNIGQHDCGIWNGVFVPIVRSQAHRSNFNLFNWPGRWQGLVLISVVIDPGQTRSVNKVKSMGQKVKVND
jgi:hypothetical protein